MRREQRERIAKRDLSQGETQTLAQQMMASWFGGKLDAFLGFANRAPAYRGPTPKRTTRPRDKGTGVPYERPTKKAPSARDCHRAHVALVKFQFDVPPTKPVAQFFRTKLAMKHPPRRPILRGVTL